MRFVQICRFGTLLVAASYVAGSLNAVPQTVVSRFPTILLVEIEAVSAPVRGDENPTYSISTRILKVVKGKLDLPSAPIEVEVCRWPDSRGRGPCAVWTSADLKSGRRYIIVGDREQNSREIIHAPVTIEFVRDDEDPVADIQFILETSSESASQQLQNAALRVRASAGRGSRFWAEYLAALLESAPDSESATLTAAIRDGALFFSAQSKVLLVGNLRRTLAFTDRPLPGVSETLVYLVGRYLAEPAEDKTLGLRDIDVYIAENVLRSIRKAPGGQAALSHSGWPIAWKRTISQRMTVLAQSGRLSPNGRAEVNRLLELLRER